jgi:ATP-dependent Lon protease
MIDYCSESDNELAVAPIELKKNSKTEENPPIERIFGWGTIIQKEYLDDGRSNIVIEGKGVLELKSYLSLEPFRIGVVQEYSPEPYNRNQDNFQEILNEIIQLTKRIIVYEGAPETFLTMVENIHSYSYPIDFIASLLQSNTSFKQSLLVEKNEWKRAVQLRDLLKRINLIE